METGTADIRSRGGAVTESSERHSLDNIEGNNKSANTTKRGEVLASGNEQGGCIEELMAGQKAYVLSETANFMQDTASVNNDEWERNGGEELGKILGWTAVDLAKYNSLTTKVNEDDRRDFLKSFEKDVMRVDDDQLNQFKDGVYMMHMKRKAIERLDANAVSSKGGMCEH